MCLVCTCRSSYPRGQVLQTCCRSPTLHRWLQWPPAGEGQRWRDTPIPLLYIPMGDHILQRKRHVGSRSVSVQHSPTRFYLTNKNASFLCFAWCASGFHYWTIIHFLYRCRACGKSFKTFRFFFTVIQMTSRFI